jgi:hypothetical protein
LDEEEFEIRADGSDCSRRFNLSSHVELVARLFRQVGPNGHGIGGHNDKNRPSLQFRDIMDRLLLKAL